MPYDIKVAIRKTAQIKQQNADLFYSIIEKYRETSFKELTVLIDDKTLGAFEAIIVKALWRAREATSMKEVQRFKEIVLGKDIAQVELTGKDGEPLNPLSKLTPEELIAQFTQVQRTLKEKEVCSLTETQPPLLELSSPSAVPSSDTE